MSGTCQLGPTLKRAVNDAIGSDEKLKRALRNIGESDLQIANADIHSVVLQQWEVSAGKCCKAELSKDAMDQIRAATDEKHAIVIQTVLEIVERRQPRPRQIVAASCVSGERQQRAFRVQYNLCRAEETLVRARPATCTKEIRRPGFANWRVTHKSCFGALRSRAIGATNRDFATGPANRRGALWQRPL